MADTAPAEPAVSNGISTAPTQDTAGDSGIEDDKSQTKRTQSAIPTSSRIPGLNRQRMPSADKPKPLTGSTATRAVTQRSESAPRTAPAARSNGTNLKTPQHHQNSGGTKMVKPTPKQSLTSPRSHSVGRGTSNGASNGTGTTTSTPSPRSSTVKSRIVTRTDHVPGGGNVKIETHKMDYGGVKSKCGSKDLMHHTPKGGDKKIETQKLEWSATSKIGSLNNASHKAGGGNKKIETVKTEWKTTSKIGSLKNAKHVPGGGDRKIETHKTEWNAKSKVGSLDNTKHVPKGGDKKIAQHKLDWKVDSKVGSLENATHKPGGGTKKIESHKLDFRENAASRTNMGLGSPASRRKRSSTPSGSQYEGSQHEGSQYEGSQHEGSQHEDAPIVGDSNGNVEA